MSHKNKKCLREQAREQLDKMQCLGRSKYDDKRAAADEWERLKPEGVSKQQYINDALRPHIYSIQTYGNYAKHLNYFWEWCEQNYNCKTLKQCRVHADEWVQSRIDAGLSPYTLKLEVAALSKIYQEPAEHFPETPSRKRGDIKRSRGYAQRDSGFSLEHHAEIIAFCRSTGLRRGELTALTGSQLIEREDGYYIGVKGKGGRYREAPIIGANAAAVVARMQAAGDDRVWESVPSHMDVHEYRSEYATAIYMAYKRDVIPKADRYICRKDRKGEVLDKVAMLAASEALGHSRISVVAGHYIR